MAVTVSDSLPQGLSTSHSLSGAVPFVLETDRDTLIVRRAILIDGKRYDLRINQWAGDHEGSRIHYSEESLFLPQVIERIRELTQEMFQNQLDSRDPTKFEVFYRESPQKCLLQDSEIRNFDVTRASKYETIRNLMSAVLEQLTCVRANWSKDGSGAMSPRVVAKEKRQRTSEPSSTQSSSTSPLPHALSLSDLHSADTEEHSVPMAKHVVEALPPAMLDKATGTLSEVASTLTGSASTQTPQGIVAHASTATLPQVKASGVQSIKALTQSLDEAAISVQEQIPASLRGVTYSALAKYSMAEPKPSPSDLAAPFAAFMKVVKDPTNTDQDRDAGEMMKWLRIMYQVAFQNYLLCQFDRVYQQDVQEIRKGETKTRNEWSKYYAAKAVAGFIKSGKKIDALVAALQAPLIQ